MKCWPEELRQDSAAIELLEYPCVDAPASFSLEAFGGASTCDDTTESDSEAPAGATATETVPAADTHAEDLLRSFESGRERGLEEGRAAERAACDALARERESRRVEDAARLAEDFRVQRERYFETVEHEVVKLALAIAARILRREAQMDPLLLTGAVRAALGQLSDSTQARLRVPASDLELWKETIASLPNLPLRPAVFGDGEMNPGECVLEAELGTADLCLASQLSEIERRFFDRSAPLRDRTEPVEIAEDMWE